MLKHWKWLGAGLMALMVLGLASTMPTSAAKPQKPPPEPPPGPITFSPIPGVLFTWVEPGGSDTANAAFLTPDDKIVVVGSTTPAGIIYVPSETLAVRFRADGTLDADFGNGGAAIVAVSKGAKNRDSAFFAADCPDGDILIAGTVASVMWMGEMHNFLARFDPDGSLDGQFGGKGIMHLDDNIGIRAVTVQPDGTIVTVFFFRDGSGAPGQYALARYTPSGTLDPSFGNGGIVQSAVDTGYATDVVMHKAEGMDDGILVVGHVANTQFGLLRYKLDGTLDLSFGNGGIVISNFGQHENPDDFAEAVTVDPINGKIVVVGNVRVPSDPGWGIYDWAVARYLPDGTLDPTFGNNGLALTDLSGWDRAHAVAIQADGKIVSAGFASMPGTGKQFTVVRHLANGTLDLDFGSGGTVVEAIMGETYARSVGVQVDGKIVVTGTANTELGPAIGLVRYNPDGSPDGTFGVEEP